MANVNKSYTKFGIVIPTIRNDLFQKWLDAWAPQFNEYNVTLYVVEDHATKEIAIDKSKCEFEIKHYCWADIDADLKENSWIIPRKCDSVRSYGFLKAYQDGQWFTVTLDDDCFPIPGAENLLKMYLEGFEQPSEYSAYYDVFDKHVSNLRQETTRTDYARGFPYKYRNTKCPVIQYGMWDNVPDFDGITQMQHEGEKAVCHSRYNVPKGLALTGCIMNAAWLTEYTPVMYQLLMGTVNGYKQPYDRWGDIWSGLLAKATCDSLNVPIAINGYASVYHSRASDTSKNIQQEASGYVANEVMWDNILEAKSIYTSSTPLTDIYINYVDAITYNRYLDKEWISHTRQAARVWCSYFEGAK